MVKNCVHKNLRLNLAGKTDTLKTQSSRHPGQTDTMILHGKK